MRKIFSNILAVAAFSLSVGAAHAASLDPLGPYYSAGTCTTGDVSGAMGAADECFGAITNGTSDVTMVNVNQATFSTSSSAVTGLFGITNWLTTVYDGSVIGLNGSGSGGVGTFDITQAIPGTVALMIDNGSAWAAYLFSGGVTAGTFSVDMSAIANGAPDHVKIITTSPIPVPAAMPLLAGALGGLMLVGRRRRKAATA